jgi:polyphosphate kinase 2 (PPK2 family)
MRESRQASEQRLLVEAMREAEQACLADMQAEQEAMAAHEAERQELEAFEAYDAAGKAERFQAWRASLNR